MKKPRIDELVMSRLLLSKKDIDPSDWQSFVRRRLVPEVRNETLCFYGPNDCLEAQYPGLDYASTAHRHRLSRYGHHKKVFKVFDELRLTDAEIQKLCRWEGTRWAREAYESSNGVKIRDTTWDGVIDFTPGKATITTYPSNTQREVHEAVQETAEGEAEASNENEDEDDDEDMESEEEEETEEAYDQEGEDEVQQSIGVELNQRLLMATEARARGEDVVLDPAWEQWMKEASERSQSDLPPVLASSSTPQQQDTSQPEVYWGREIPAYLSDDISPEMAAIRARLPPPPQYYPALHPNAMLLTVNADPSPTIHSNAD